MALFVLFFPASGCFETPQTLQNEGKRKMTNRPFFTPPQGHPFKGDRENLKLQPTPKQIQVLRVSPPGIESLRAKGTLISEPRFSTPARRDFSHARKGKWPLSRVFLRKGRFPFLKKGGTLGSRDLQTPRQHPITVVIYLPGSDF